MADKNTKQEQEKNENFDNFLSFRKQGFDIQHLEAVLANGSPDEVNKELSRKRSLAYKFAKDMKLRSAENKTEEQYNDPNSIEIDFQTLREAVNRHYSSFFSSDEAKKTISAIPQGTLENMVLLEDPEKPFLANATDGKGKLVYLAYNNYLGMKEKAKRFEEGRPANEDERKEYFNTIALGASEEQTKRIREHNKLAKKDKKKIMLDESLIQALANAAQRAVLSGEIKKDDIAKYVVSGSKVQIDKAKKAYEEAVAKKGTDIYGVARESIGNLAKEVENRVPMMDRLYQAHNIKK